MRISTAACCPYDLQAVQQIDFFGFSLSRGIVVANALRQTLPDFLLAPAKTDSLTKFITDRQDTQNMRIFRLAS